MQAYFPRNVSSCWWECWTGSEGCSAANYVLQYDNPIYTFNLMNRYSSLHAHTRRKRPDFKSLFRMYVPSFLHFQDCGKTTHLKFLNWNATYFQDSWQMTAATSNLENPKQYLIIVSRSQSCEMSEVNEVCRHCNQVAAKFPKTALEALLRCRDCPAKGGLFGWHL